MSKNGDLQKDVQDTINWEPLLRAAEMGVTVKDGIVSLTCIVDSYSKKTEVEEAAKSVAGVKAVVEKIEIKFGEGWKKNDNDIAVEILNAFKWNWEVPGDKISVKVEDGWVTIGGELNWNYKKETANRVMLKGIVNSLYQKEEAGRIAWGTPGVWAIDNELVIDYN